MSTAATAMNSPKMMILPNSLKLCRYSGMATMTPEAATPTRNTNWEMYKPQLTSRLMPVRPRP